MEIKVNIDYNQVFRLIKQLPLKQLSKLKTALDKEVKSVNKNHDFKSFLLNAPTFNDNQIEQIEQTRKSINQWRAK